MENKPKNELQDALRSVRVPGLDRDVVALGFVRKATVCDGIAGIAYQIPADLLTDSLRQQLGEATQAALQSVGGLKKLELEFIAVAPRSAQPLPGVAQVIAVGAGKGGVGKSTVATLLAYGLKRRGLSVGLLDADVYGPSIPKITGTESAKPTADAQGRLIPPTADGIPIMSMGYMVPPDQAVIWRGPMAQKYVKEFLDRGLWGELDCLIVDLPPGTGDIPLTLAQSIPLTGAVIVCTPQDLALLDAVKALRMYEKLGVPTLGFVENMSYYVCPQCGHRAEIFSHGGCEQTAERLGVPFLGGIPLNIAIRQAGDGGRPPDMFSRVEGYVATAIESVVQRLSEEMARSAAAVTPLPTLTIRG
jgi:ATP-binding protein involved in chromosome partitioning